MEIGPITSTISRFVYILLALNCDPRIFLICNQKPPSTGKSECENSELLEPEKVTVTVRDYADACKFESVCLWRGKTKNGDIVYYDQYNELWNESRESERVVAYIVLVISYQRRWWNKNLKPVKRLGISATYRCYC